MSHFAVVDQAVNVMKQVESYISVGMEMTIDVASDFGEYEKDVNCEETLKDVMLDYIQMERDFKQFIESVKYVKQQVEKGSEIEDLEEILDTHIQELKSQNDDSVFQNHEKYVDLIDKIQEVRNTEEGNTNTDLVPMTTEDEDLDVEMTQQNMVTKCPYTGQEMTFPVRNIICGHNYEKEGIMEYISKRKHKARCPVSGCHSDQTVTADNLEENKDLRRFIERKKRQGGQRSKSDKKRLN
ncbi:hypothetical protein SNE40_021610 [Patella caerulea]|uniref:E3 SUMO-protein ligase NSE2 n=1 Tax=Patella caerulea TaxID=87958 RepID=A0AAN8GBG1_PATCE